MRTSLTKLTVLVVLLTLGANKIKAQSPDLKFGLTYSYGYDQTNQIIYLDWDLSNGGGGSNTTFTIAYLASTDLVLDVSDYVLDYTAYNGIVGGAFGTINYSVQLPPNYVATGLYNFIVFIDYGDKITESNENNNYKAFGTFNFVSTAIGINEYNNKKVNFNISPNPVKDEFIISMSDATNLENLHLSLLDPHGKELMSEKVGETLMKTKKYDVTHIPNGVYLLILKNGKEVIRSKKILIAN